MMNNLIPITYILNKGTDIFDMIIIDATEFDETTGEPISWSVRKSHGSNVMSKKHGIFCYEPNPSSRTKSFFKEFRFKTPEEAAKTYFSFGYKPGLHIPMDNPNYPNAK